MPVLVGMATKGRHRAESDSKPGRRSLQLLHEYGQTRRRDTVDGRAILPTAAAGSRVDRFAGGSPRLPAASPATISTRCAASSGSSDARTSSSADPAAPARATSSKRSGTLPSTATYVIIWFTLEDLGHLIRRHHRRRPPHASHARHRSRRRLTRAHERHRRKGDDQPHPPSRGEPLATSSELPSGHQRGKPRAIDAQGQQATDRHDLPKRLPGRNRTMRQRTSIGGVLAGGGRPC